MSIGLLWCRIGPRGLSRLCCCHVDMFCAFLISRPRRETLSAPCLRVTQCRSPVSSFTRTGFSLGVINTSLSVRTRKRGNRKREKKLW
ncbi:uncharacterized [Tachysurus ichikawai]